MHKDTAGHNHAPCTIKGEGLDIKDRLFHWGLVWYCNIRSSRKLGRILEGTPRVVFWLLYVITIVALCAGIVIEFMRI